MAVSAQFAAELPLVPTTTGLRSCPWPRPSKQPFGRCLTDRRKGRSCQRRPPRILAPLPAPSGTCSSDAWIYTRITLTCTPPDSCSADHIWQCQAVRSAVEVHCSDIALCIETLRHTVAMPMHGTCAWQAAVQGLGWGGPGFMGRKSAHCPPRRRPSRYAPRTTASISGACTCAVEGLGCDPSYM